VGLLITERTDRDHGAIVALTPGRVTQLSRMFRLQARTGPVVGLTLALDVSRTRIADA